MSYLLLTIGIFGLMGATALFPLIGLLCSKSGKRSQRCSHTGDHSLTLKIIIPVAPGSHAALGRTLQSLHAVQWPSQCSVSLLVSIDGKDEAMTQLATFCGVSFREHLHHQGKWALLKEAAIEGAYSDWVAFIDVGTVFPASFGEDLLEELLVPSTGAIFPGYRIEHGGSQLHQIFWRLEGALKALENRIGGTVSAHGATVLYRGTHLRNIFSFLNGREYANDDVVIPLVGRFIAPRLENRYLSEVVVSDSDVSFQNSHARRKRLMLGNLQWIADFSPILGRQSFGLALVMLRRILRTFWAYWIGCVGLALVLSFPIIGISLILCAVFIYLFSHALQDLLQAFRFSLESPFRLFFSDGGYDWK